MAEIKVLGDDLLSDLSLFQSEIAKMDALFDELKAQIGQMGGFWSGDDSDKVAALMQQFTANFEPLSEKNKKYSTFLNNTIEKYKALDEKISGNISSGNSGF